MFNMNELMNLYSTPSIKTTQRLSQLQRS